MSHVGDHQLRHLIESDHGLLGTMGFAGSALAVAARDEWTGWPSAMRRKQLCRVLGLSRLLASKVLSRALRQLPDDFR